MSVPSVPKQFVYAQQDILGGTTKTNDLVVVNDKDYKDSGICVGPGGPFNNMRLSYSVNEAAGNITTDTLNFNVEQLYFKNLPSAQNIRKSCNYLVADLNGNVKEGYPQFTGDINSEVNTIKDDIILIKQSLGLPVVRTTTIESILAYIAIGLCILFFIILVILLIRMHRLNKRLRAAENLLEKVAESTPSNQQPTAQYPYGMYPPPPPQYPYGMYPPPPQMSSPPSPTAQFSSPPTAQFSSPPQTQFGSPPQTQFSSPPQTQFGSPPQTQFGSPPQTQFGRLPKSPLGSVSSSSPRPSPLASPTAFSGYRYYY